MPHGRRERAKLSWLPLWDWPPAHSKDYSPCRWAGKFIKYNRWRCDRIYSEQDLMQEAYLVFMRIAEKYPRVTSAEGFMKLYKRSLTNWFHDRAAYMQRKNKQHVYLNIDPTELLSQIGECHPNGINILLSEAPDELRLALGLLTEQPELIKAAGNPDGNRENLNMKLRRILGLSEKFDLRAALTELLFN